MTRPRYMTLRILLEKLKKQQGTDDLEHIMDVPLCVGISDGMRNFDYGTIFVDYPRFSAPRPEDGYLGQIRLDCHTNNKRLVEKTKRKKQ